VTTGAIHNYVCTFYIRNRVEIVRLFGESESERHPLFGMALKQSAMLAVFEMNV